jgi:hypothetical protein
MTAHAALPPVADTAAARARTRRRRPVRHVVTAPRLEDLRGPAGGVVELPHRIVWQANPRVDLDHPELLLWAYEAVLREAASIRELETLLDGPTLARVWPDLHLPANVREAWEGQHPGLRRAAA